MNNSCKKKKTHTERSEDTTTEKEMEEVAEFQ